MKLTAIIPLRVTEGLYQAQERLQRIVETIPAERYDILIVDYGTPAEYRGILSAVQGAHVSVHRCDVEGEIFSIGHARDVGVQQARTEVVMFHDIDFLGSRQTYYDIVNEAHARCLSVNAYDFFCVPVFFLTEVGSAQFLDTLKNSEFPEHQFHIRLFEGDKEALQFAAYGSSAMVVNRYHYLSLGGHSRQFYGHGAEDFDVLHRLSSYSAKGPRTADYLTDTKSNQIAEYRGFRAYFALYGLDVFARGIFFAHLWHPTRTFPGYHQSRRNFGLLTELMQSFDRDRVQPNPLHDPFAKGRSLILLDPTTSTFRSIRQAVPAYGDARILHESTFSSGPELESYCLAHDIERVLFSNPYGNPHRLELYRHIRASSRKFHVFDRGALPDSWFFDDGGFNFDSATYRPEAWDRPLSDELLTSVRSYIETLRRSDTTLEANAPRATGEFVRERLGIGRRRVVFVPFQRPSDTVTTYFAGPSESVSRFTQWIKNLRTALPKSEWVVVCKTHPLEGRDESLTDVVYADQFHVHDLLELADVVVLMNSGVGVLGLAFGKPVVCCSEAFYAHDGLAHTVRDETELLRAIHNAVAPRREAVERFYGHLIFRVYSFGASEYRKTVAEDGSHRNIVREIRFRSLILPGLGAFEFGKARTGISLDAPLFASFGGRAGVKATLAAKRPAARVAPKPATRPASKPVAPPATGLELVTSRTAFARKTRKLFRNPRQFFRDFLHKRGL